MCYINLCVLVSYNFRCLYTCRDYQIYLWHQYICAISYEKLDWSFLFFLPFYPIFLYVYVYLNSGCFEFRLWFPSILQRAVCSFQLIYNYCAICVSSQIDTKNILFICGGAFVDLEKTISERLHKSWRLYNSDINNMESAVFL